MALGVLILVFTIILLQDIKYRAVHWFLFPILLIVVLIHEASNLKALVIIQNVGFVSFMMLGLTLYLRMKYNKWINMLNGFFCLGDLLFLLILTPLFSNDIYVMFFCVGTFGSLLIYWVANVFVKQETIPFAGYMSLIAIPFTCFESRFENFIAIL